jgi:Holliday junction resolvase-like predicted endonuclease
MEYGKLSLKAPENWTNTEKGTFFEEFISELIKPMGYSITSQVRFTGMEIDLLAKHDISNEIVFVECKAYSDSMPSDFITKLLGNVQMRKANAGWLFSTSEFGKDGKGSWEEIKNDPELSQKFIWYSPNAIIKLLIKQGKIKQFSYIEPLLKDYSIGESTLIYCPKGIFCVVDIIDNSIPRYSSCFNASMGTWLSKDEYEIVAESLNISPKLEMLFANNTSRRLTIEQIDKVANVISGDSWDDPRPARPNDFVGRDLLLDEIGEYFTNFKNARTQTRIFTLEGPSGWGKSSLLLKISDALQKSSIEKYVFVLFDTRSVTNNTFVNEAVRLLFFEAKKKGYISKNTDIIISSSSSPLESKSIQQILIELKDKHVTPVLIFDQFEELFYKEDLLDTFNSIRNLCFYIDSNQVDLILGFAWKTDISLPQNHPAYYLWHSLSDRRKSFIVKEFGKSDIQKVVAKAEKNYSKLPPPKVVALCAVASKRGHNPAIRFLRVFRFPLDISHSAVFYLHLARLWSRNILYSRNDFPSIVSFSTLVFL